MLSTHLGKLAAVAGAALIAVTSGPETTSSRAPVDDPVDYKKEIEPLLLQVRETLRDGTDTGKGKRKGSADLNLSAVDEGRTRELKPREAKRPKMVNTSTSNDSKSVSSASKGGRKPPHEVYCKPAPEFGKGWIVRGFQRQSGAYEGHIDKYWYSPKLKKRFRSKAEIKRFLPLLKKYKGDEEKAYKMK